MRGGGTEGLAHEGVFEGLLVTNASEANGLNGEDKALMIEVVTDVSEMGRRWRKGERLP